MVFRGSMCPVYQSPYSYLHYWRQRLLISHQSLLCCCSLEGKFLPAMAHLSCVLPISACSISLASASIWLVTSFFPLRTNLCWQSEMPACGGSQGLSDFLALSFSKPALQNWAVLLTMLNCSADGFWGIAHPWLSCPWILIYLSPMRKMPFVFGIHRSSSIWNKLALQTM